MANTELSNACEQLRKALNSQKANTVKCPRLPLKRDRKVTLCRK